MHDPLTQIFVIRSPFGRKMSLFNKGEYYYEPLITIWHRDPEKDGSDDSCGWYYTKIDNFDKIVDKLVKDEKNLHELWDPSGIAKADPMSSIFAAFEIVSWRCFKQRIKSKHLVRIIEVATNPVDNLRNFFAGFDMTDERDVEWFFSCIVKIWLEINRPWYKHPRYHVWHWRIQIHPIQKLKRYLFTRCGYCGKGFKYGESGFGTWNGEGPMWFKSEKMWHDKCNSKVNDKRSERNSHVYTERSGTTNN